MAEQSGILPLRGTLGNINFFRKGNAYKARTKTSVDANRIANDVAFERTRENGQEFGRAGSGSKILRRSISTLIKKAADKKMRNRSMKEMMRVVKADTVNIRGGRTVVDGDLSLLKGFEFNINGILSLVLSVQYTHSYDRALGELTVSLPAFIPLDALSTQAGTTHFRINTAAVEINWADETFITDVKTSAEFPWDPVMLPAQSFTLNVTPASTKPVFLLLGIDFYQHVNGFTYPLKNGSFNSLAIINVDMV